jgi:hypothetical protein
MPSFFFGTGGSDAGTGSLRRFPTAVRMCTGCPASDEGVLFGNPARRAFKSHSGSIGFCSAGSRRSGVIAAFRAFC